MQITFLNQGSLTHTNTTVEIQAVKRGKRSRGEKNWGKWISDFRNSASLLMTMAAAGSGRIVARCRRSDLLATYVLEVYCGLRSRFKLGSNVAYKTRVEGWREGGFYYRYVCVLLCDLFSCRGNEEWIWRELLGCLWSAWAPHVACKMYGHVWSVGNPFPELRWKRIDPEILVLKAGSS